MSFSNKLPLLVELLYLLTLFFYKRHLKTSKIELTFRAFIGENSVRHFTVNAQRNCTNALIMFFYFPRLSLELFCPCMTPSTLIWVGGGGGWVNPHPRLVFPKKLRNVKSCNPDILQHSVIFY